MQSLADSPAPVPDMPFSRAEFSGRRERLVELLKRRSIDVTLVSSPANFYWLTGLAANITSHVFALALRSDGQGVWIGRRMEMSNVAALAAWCWATDTIPIDDSEDAFSRLADALQRIGGAGASVGIELSSAQMSAGGFARLRVGAPGLQFVDSTGLVESLRSVKSPAELAYLREAGAITGAAITAAIQNLGVGTMDSDVAARLVSVAIRLGSEPMAEGPYVTCGSRSFRAHSSWNHVPIARGEIINTELAAARAHYHTPLFRVSVLGEASDALRRFHDASLAGLQAGLDGIGPGMTSGEADAIVREAIGRTGYGEYFTVRAAYGIGVGFPPGWGENSIVNIRPGDGRILEPGMCFHLVPALYKAELGAVCCSMPIHITGNGVGRLTDVEPRLFVLGS